MKKNPPFLFDSNLEIIVPKTLGNERQRQRWLANSEFRENDPDLISCMANLFRPMDAYKSGQMYGKWLISCRPMF